jgi:hypothetical protein
MPKSTPLSQLRNRNQPAPPQVQEQQPPMEVQNENELVNEILREIDGGEQQMMQPQANVNSYVEEYDYPIQEQHNPYMHQQQQQMMMPQYEEPEIEQEEEKTLFEELKDHLYVGLIVLVLSMPQVTDIVTKFMPKKDFIQNNLKHIILLVKALLGAIMSFVINNFL